MILWINGTYGVGKTSVCEELQNRLPDSHLFDPENIGSVIRNVLPPSLWKDDYQDYPFWRSATASLLQLAAESYSGVILMPMTVVSISYQREILEPLRSAGIPVCLVTLLARRETILARLLGRGEEPDAWCIQQIDRCAAALESGMEGCPIDTEGKSIPEIAEEIQRLFLSTEE